LQNPYVCNKGIGKAYLTAQASWHNAYGDKWYGSTVF